MRRFRSDGSGRLVGWLAAITLILILSISGCGGHPPAGQSSFPARVSISPAVNTSLQIGGVISFSASAQNATGGTVSASFTFSSSDSTILNIAPNGVACAGRWDAGFTTCTPGGIGVVKVTASTQNVFSAPTFVFVHPPIDNITVTGVLLDGLPIQEPCLSQSQTMTVEAHAFSQGTDITQSVGPFTWSANNPSVVGINPIVNEAYNFPTNQATAKALTPGITQIYASASGVSSTTFQQPTLLDRSGTPIPVVLDFFETCPIQNIVLEVGNAGSQQTSFAVSRGTSETVFATLTDVMGNSSLPNSSNAIVLSRIPLTWTTSNPAVIATSTGCNESCAVTTGSAGAGSVSASCSPPICNIGFPLSPPVLSSAQCAQYFPPSCQQFIPLPVYASPLPPACPTCEVHTTAAISGVVTGAAGGASILASSLGCALDPPANCATGIYAFSAGTPKTGTATAMPSAPNSLLFDLTGDKVYMGSVFGAQIISPSNLGTQNSAFTPLGTVTGIALAVSATGNMAVFSDTLHTPNQVYIVNTTNATAPVITPLNISESNTAAFSPDGLKAFIFGLDSNGSPTLYVYSPLQALQAIPLPAKTSVNSIVFSTNSAFAYVVEPSLGGGGPAVSVFNTCNNQPFTDTVTGLHDIPLAGTPVAFKALPDGVHFLALDSDGTLEYFAASITGIPPAKLTAPPTPASSLCPMTVGHTKLPSINLGQGSIQPVDFFTSADGTLIYVLASDRNSILVYNFTTGAVTGIELIGPGNPTPLHADMTADAGMILVAGSDGMLHEVSTAIGGSDQYQVAFPNLANYQNPFCTFVPASGACTFDYIAAKP